MNQQGCVEDFAAAVEMIRAHEEFDHDPFAPYDASMDYANQVAEVHCRGCSAIGEKRWPDWEVHIEHAPACKWLAYRRIIGAWIREN